MSCSAAGVAAVSLQQQSEQKGCPAPPAAEGLREGLSSAGGGGRSRIFPNDAVGRWRLLLFSSSPDLITFAFSLFISVVIPKSPLPASEVNSEKPSMHSSTKTVLGHQQGQGRRKAGKKRGRTTKALIHQPMPAPSKSVEPLKFPRKRGPKPGSKVKAGADAGGCKAVLHACVCARLSAAVGEQRGARGWELPCPLGPPHGEAVAPEPCWPWGSMARAAVLAGQPGAGRLCARGAGLAGLGLVSRVWGTQVLSA